MATRAKTTRRRAAAVKPAIENGVRLTNPDRVLFPEQGITKRQLAEYYVAVAERMLPYLAGRPLALVRCPAGVGKGCFYQKHPPQGLPDAVRRIRVREKSGTDTYLVVEDLDGIVALVQFGSLEIHVWGSLAADIERPDRLVFDLDPGPDVPWKETVATAILLRDLFDELGLVSFVKTTGGKGLHVVVPIEPRDAWTAVKDFCHEVVVLLERAFPQRYLTKASKAARGGRIFLDYLRNERGATSVAAYSTRALAGAPVSMPVSWNKLGALGGARDFTVENVPKRLRSQKSDPWKDLPTTRQSLPNLKGAADVASAVSRRVRRTAHGR